MNLKLSLIATALLFAGCGGDDGGTPAPDAAPTGPVSILATAKATPSLSSLVAAVEFASDNNDLVDLLSDPGTLTVFAPTNAAFDALAVELTGMAGATAADILVAANKAAVKSVLQYHVLTTKVNAAGIQFGKAIVPAGGGFFKITAGTPPVIQDGSNRTANITATDIEATNGVVHLIDKVLFPAEGNIVEVAQAARAGMPPEFTILVEAVVAANLVTTLSGDGPFTVFAPTDAAFAAALTELGLTKAQLLASPLLDEILTYHVVSGRVLKADVPVGTPITTVEGGTFTINAQLAISDEQTPARSSNITATDVFAKNGVVHVIDKVILPNSFGAGGPGPR